MSRSSGVPLAVLALVAALPVATLAQDVAVEPPPAADVVTRGARLQGTAFLARNRPVIGATVTVREAGESSRLFLTATDDKGQFLIDGLANGNYRVQVEREGLTPVVKTDVQVRFPFRAIVEVAMQPITGATATSAVPPDDAAVENAEHVVVRGVARAHDEGNVAVGEARMRLVHNRGEQDPRQVATAEDGSFEIADLPAGVWRLETRGAGFLPLRTMLAIGSDAVLDVFLVRQPAGHDPSPLDLMPDEQPVPPAGLRAQVFPLDLRPLQRTAK